MVLSSKFKNKLTINKLMDIMVDQVTLTALPQVLNAMPNAPPLLKAGVDLATGFGQLEIAGKIAANVPSPINKILKAGIEIEGITQMLQALPNFMAAFGSGGMNFLSPQAQQAGA